MTAIVQSSVGQSDRTMPGAITAGHLLVVAYGCRGSTVPSFSGQGYTQIPDGVTSACNLDRCSIWYKVAGASESTTLTLSNNQTNCAWLELDIIARFNAHNAANDGCIGFGQASVAAVAAASDFVIGVVTEGTDGGWGLQSFTPPAGWTELMDLNNPTDHPTSYVGYKLSSPGGTETNNPLCTASGWWSAQIATFSPVPRPQIVILR